MNFIINLKNYFSFLMTKIQNFLIFKERADKLWYVFVVGFIGLPLKISIIMCKFDHNFSTTLKSFF
jgi:hypothetical protein